MVNDLVGMGKLAESFEKGTKEIRQLTYDFLAPPVKEVGQLIADKIRFNRFSNAIQAMKEAKKMIKAAGIQQKPVDLKIFMPLIEFCSLEEDHDMVSRWAGLLASAAIGGMMLPAFVRILSELSADEAMILDYIYIHRKKVDGIMDTVSNPGVDKEELIAAIGLPEEEYGIRILDLLRLRLIEQVTTDAMNWRPGYGDWGAGGYIGLTALGEAFISACKGPSKKSPE